jgi:PrtD family type I secretion system ABC transporter
MDDKDANFLKNITHACRNAIYVVGLFSFFINILMLTTSIYMLQIYDRVLASRSYDTLIFLTIVALVALVTLALLDVARSRVLVNISHWLDATVSPKALQKCPDELLRGRQYGPQALRDISTLRQFIAGSGIITLFDAPWLPIYLVAILYLSPSLFFIATLGALILFGLAVMNEYVTRSMLDEASVKAMTAQYYVDASLRNAEVIQAMGMMPNIIQHWEDKNTSVLQLQTIASNRASTVLAISKFARLALQIFMLAIGAYLVIRNDLTGGGMIAATILLSRALAPVEQSIGVWKQTLASRLAYRRLQKHFDASTREEINMKLPDPKGALTLDHVTYQVPNMDHAILTDISMHVRPGEIIAVIGPSGAGKSTLARLIVGALKATNGEIRLDGADVYSWDRREFGKHVGYLPQDIELFNDTIKSNIARMGLIEEKDVISAAELAGVHQLIVKLPKAYDTKIGSGSFLLSGGQKQRIAIARAVYQDPKLLVMDEPNANLDSEGENALVHLLHKLKERSATQILITHKPSLVMHADRILFLIEGKIRLFGPRDQVLAEIKQLHNKSKPT